MLSGGQSPAGIEGIGAAAYAMSRIRRPDQRVCVTYDEIKDDVTKGPDIYRTKRFCVSAYTVEEARVMARKRARWFFSMPVVLRALTDFLL